MNNDFLIYKLSMEANMKRIEVLLNKEGIENKFNKDGWYSINRDNTELRQRMLMLRKDSIQLEKLIHEK